ncbi:glycosyltransferase [uncultured Bacteroides sp.]|uniref:glycosyltransferase n=1 Tax=uncultured Bacteroides sp. TaxID=162156 RepID=UPI00263125E7|nr:glycosyltransferase [uncultured Bacteroides sp.]
MKILINSISAKKESGGAFQIAINFILKSLEHNDVEWYYIVSQDVDEVIGEKFNSLKGKHYFVYITQPDFLGSYMKVKKEVAVLEKQIKPDLIYSVTAPSYFTFKTKEVMRYTNPWVTHPNKYSWSTYSFTSKIRQYLYCLNQKKMMKAAYAFITQTETTKNGIIRVTGVSSDRVCVVNNVLPEAFKTMDTSPIYDNEWINIACIGSPHLHKNFDILPKLIIELEKNGVRNVCFHTTIPLDSPMIKKVVIPLEKVGMSKHINNHGRVSQKELNEIYRRCQFCFIPTLLEVFSASTIEAMYYSLPIVATDFDFNKDVLQDSCLYYEPQNAADAAKKFVTLIANKKIQEECKLKMQKQLQKYGNYDIHFKAIKKYLINVAKGNI